MTTKYNIIQHQVAPILQDAAHAGESLGHAGQNVTSQIAQALAACQLPLVAGALQDYEDSVGATLASAVSLASRVITAGATATNDYVQADYRMTQQAHQALKAGIPTAVEIKLEHQR